MRSTFLSVLSNIDRADQENLFAGSSIDCPSCLHHQVVTTFFHEVDIKLSVLLRQDVNAINQNALPIFDIGLYSPEKFHENDCKRDCDLIILPQDSGQTRIIFNQQKEVVGNGQSLTQWFSQNMLNVPSNGKFCLLSLLIQDPKTSAITMLEEVTKKICTYDGVKVIHDVLPTMLDDKILIGFVLQDQTYFATSRLPTVRRPETLDPLSKSRDKSVKKTAVKTKRFNPTTYQSANPTHKKYPVGTDLKQPQIVYSSDASHPAETNQRPVVSNHGKTALVELNRGQGSLSEPKGGDDSITPPVNCPANHVDLNKPLPCEATKNEQTKE